MHNSGPWLLLKEGQACDEGDEQVHMGVSEVMGNGV